MMDYVRGWYEQLKIEIKISKNRYKNTKNGINNVQKGNKKNTQKGIKLPEKGVNVEKEARNYQMGKWLLCKCIM